MDKILTSVELGSAISDASAAKPNLNGVQRSVTTLMQSWPSDKGLYQQLKRLAAFIEQTKAEIAALRPDEVKSSFLPKATDELDAIVAATADASTRIMDAGDVLMEMAGELPADKSEKMMNAVTSIFEACSFQDITGQRITKVVKTLKVIEDRIDQMLTSETSLPSLVAPEPLPASFGELSDEDLLNGPQLPGAGRSQAEIDALLGFG